MFRAIRSALPNDPIAQERIVGSVLTALAIADVRMLIYNYDATTVILILSLILSGHTVSHTYHPMVQN